MTTHFKSIVIDTAENTGNIADLISFYSQKKELLKKKLEECEELLEKTASSYEDDIAAGCGEEIGAFTKVAVEDHWAPLREEEDPKELDDEPFMKDMLTAVVLDFLLEQKIISVPEEEEESSDDIVGREEYEDDD